MSVLLNRSDYPLYAKALELYLDNNSKFNSFIERNKLSRKEKVLLKARYFLKKKQYEQAKSLIADTTFSKGSFLYAESLFITSQLLFQESSYEKSIAATLEALSAYQKIEDRRGIFLCSYNLSVDYQRMRLLILSDHFLSMANEYTQSDKEKLLIVRAKASNFSLNGDIEKAILELNSVYDNITSLTTNDQIITDTVAYSIYFKAKKYDKVLEINERIIRSKNNRDHVRFEFEQQVIKSLLFKDTIKITKNIKENPEYYLKTQILKALEENSYEKALCFWNKLYALDQSRFESTIQEHVKRNEECVFSYFLKDNLKEKQQKKESVISLPNSPKLKKLYSLLSSTNKVFNKEELVRNIWNQKYEKEFDSRLYKLIQRLKDIEGIEILNINKGYQLL